MVSRVGNRACLSPPLLGDGDRGHARTGYIPMSSCLGTLRAQGAWRKAEKTVLFTYVHSKAAQCEARNLVSSSHRIERFWLVISADYMKSQNNSHGH